MVGTVTYIKSIAIDSAALWFVAWGIRKKYDLDLGLSTRGWLIRLLVICCGIFSLCLRSHKYEYVRVVGGLLGIAFLVWPNFAFHLSELFDADERS